MAILGTTGGAPNPTFAADAMAPTVRVTPAELVAGTALGVELTDGGRQLILAHPPLSGDDPEYPFFGLVDSEPIRFGGPSSLTGVSVEADAPVGTDIDVSVRGRVGTEWTEWREPSDLAGLDGSTSIQARLTLRSSAEGLSPRVTGVRATTEPYTDVRAAQATLHTPPTSTIMATRIGMVGHTTANGHVVTDRDRFVALPSKRALNALGGNDYLVQISYHGRTTVLPVWDIGPWNTNDDYWNDARERFTDLPRWTSQAEAAFFTNYNGGRDGMGRQIVLPNSIDIADGGFWDDLGMTQNDWVDVTFMWMNAPSPPRRATPAVTPKTASTTGTPSTTPPRGRAAGYSAPTPGSPVFVPLVTADPNGWTTSWSVQNASGASISGTVELYDGTGTQAGRMSFTLPPWGSDTSSVADVPGMGPTFSGSAVIKASGAVAVMVNGDRPSMDRMAYEGVLAGATTLSAPFVVKDHSGWSSGIQVQNLGTVPTTVRISYITAAGSMTDETAAIAPMAVQTFFQPANNNLPRGFVGSATIQSLNGQPLAAIVAATSTDGGAMAYSTVSTGTDVLFAPVIYRRYNGWDSGIQIQNMNPAPARAQVTYQGTGLGAPASENVVVPGGGTLTLYQPASTLLPDGFVGSARIVGEPGSRLAGLVSEVQTGGAAMNYVLGRPLGMSAVAPFITKGADGWSTGIQVQNPGPAPSGITLTFYSEDGDLVFSTQDTLDAGGSRTYYPPAIPDIPANFRGSAVIQATTGQPIAVVVNETAP